VPPAIARLLVALALITSLTGQQPFYTDDASVTDAGQWHFEFFDEFDALQHSQFPNLRQNTANYKLNVGLPHRLEIDVDSPFLAIFRASPQASAGLGDTNLGMKWNFRQERDSSRLPALSATFYVELPTGDTDEQLGSGLNDYWLNFIAQKHISAKNRITANAGLLFAGNTSTGVLGIQSKRGRVSTGGVSFLREVTPRLTLGAEIYGGFTSQFELARSQFQALAGGKYAIRNGLSFDFGLLGGRYVASPRIGAQIGFSVDFPAALR
jgi:Putative MetA-pathway of phenol degradation